MLNAMFTAPSSLTTANAHLVLQEGLTAIAAGQKEFDFAATGQTDSSAVAMLLAWQRAAKAKGFALTLRNLPSSVQSLAALYDVASLLGIPAPASNQAQAGFAPPHHHQDASH